MTRLILLAAALPLAACGGRQTPPQPIIVPQEVVVAGAPVPCVPETVGERPEYPDTVAALRAAPDAAARYQLIAGGRKLRDARLNVLEPVIASCRK